MSSVTENFRRRSLTGGTLFDTVNQSFTNTLAEIAFPRVVPATQIFLQGN
jgi:hypothetical protein